MPFFSRRKRSKRDDEGAGPPPTSHSNRTSEAGDATGVDPLASLQDFEKAHTLDPNLPLNQLNEIEAALAAGDAELGQALERDLVEDNNPYPEVSSKERTSIQIRRMIS